MKYRFTFNIDCGELTCFNLKTKKPCRFFMQNMKGTTFCALFGNTDLNENFTAKRHRFCLQLAGKFKRKGNK